MKIRVVHTKRFNARLTRLARRFPSVLDEVEALKEDLKRGDRPGDLYRGIGVTVNRVRRANRSAGTGKRGGFRITYYVHTENLVAMLAISQRKDAPFLSVYEID